jgi:hypothetical protein
MIDWKRGATDLEVRPQTDPAHWGILRRVSFMNFVVSSTVGQQSGGASLKQRFQQWHWYQLRTSGHGVSNVALIKKANAGRGCMRLEVDHVAPTQ